MSANITIGLLTEGTTDQRFLKNIIQRTFESFELEITIIDVLPLKKSKGSFKNKVLKASKEAFEAGVNVLCVQSDADNESNKKTYKYSISPAKEALDKESAQTHCKILVPIVPIYMIETWLLADKALFKAEIGTNKSDNELKINGEPETIKKPKEIITKAIGMARKGSKRYQNLSISDLYEPLGATISLEKLAKLSSYQDFRENIKNAFEMLKLL